MARPAPEPASALSEPDEDDLELDQPITPAPELLQRPRLRLTPTATDREFSDVFEQATGRAPPEAPKGPEGRDDWTWKDLLSAMDNGDAGGQGEAGGAEPPLEDALRADIAELGIDPAALLPRARIDEIAAAIQAQDFDGAREVVRRLAPAATRRLARKLFSDDRLKRRAIAHLNEHQDLLAEAIERDHEGRLAAELLATEAGRVFLLLDAAAGDLI